MDLGDTFTRLIVKKEEEEQQVEVIEQADIRLMLFPSQIHKIGCLISLLTYHRDLLQRYNYFYMIHTFVRFLPPVKSLPNGINVLYCTKSIQVL